MELIWKFPKVMSIEKKDLSSLHFDSDKTVQMKDQQLYILVSAAYLTYPINS